MPSTWDAYQPQGWQQEDARKAAGTWQDDNTDAGNWNTGDSYLDELRSGSVAGSEDWRRFSNDQLREWQPYYLGNGQFRTFDGGVSDKPTNTTTGNPGGGWGGGGAGGSWGGSGGGWGGGSGRSFGTFGGAPQYQWDKFVAPNPEDVANDPAYQFRLGEGTKAIEGSAAAKGLLRTGGTLKDLAEYGQDLASQEYGNMFNRALGTWGANYQGGKDAFAPAYGSWENLQNQALQKYLQREGNIYGLINTQAPMAPGY